MRNGRHARKRITLIGIDTRGCQILATSELHFANHGMCLLEIMVALVHFSACHRPHELPRHGASTRQSPPRRKKQGRRARWRKKREKGCVSSRGKASIRYGGTHDRNQIVVDVVDCPACSGPHAPPGHGASAAGAVPGAVEGSGQDINSSNGRVIHPVVRKRTERSKLQIKLKKKTVERRGSSCECCALSGRWISNRHVTVLLVYMV